MAPVGQLRLQAVHSTLSVWTMHLSQSKTPRPTWMALFSGIVTALIAPVGQTREHSTQLTRQ
jgi:hypothetical protein